MSFAATMIFYHLIGLGVATAVFLTDSQQGRLLPVFGGVLALRNGIRPWYV
jgi:hypothetical protein